MAYDDLRHTITPIGRSGIVWYCECTASSPAVTGTDLEGKYDTIRPQGTCEAFLAGYRVDASMPDTITEEQLQATELTIELGLIDNDYLDAWTGQETSGSNGAIPRRMFFRAYLPPIPTGDQGVYPGRQTRFPRTVTTAVGAAESSPVSGTQANPLGSMWGPGTVLCATGKEGNGTDDMVCLTGPDGVFLPKPIYVGFGGAVGLFCGIQAAVTNRAPYARFRFIFLCARELADLMPWI